MAMDRRGALRGALAVFGAAAVPRGARAQAGSLFAFAGDDGRQVYNYRLPSDLSADNLPGVVWAGAPHPDVILVEYFDYNCPSCRGAAGEVDALLRANPGLRLGLVNDPLLGPGSREAARVQQAVLRAAGPATAYAFHRALLARRGPADQAGALAAAGALGLDARALADAAALPLVGDVVARHAALASALGFEATPCFSLGNIGLLGYPGPDALQRAVAHVKRCDRLACG